MTVFLWFLLIFIILALVLLLFFLFYVLLPSSSNAKLTKINPVFSSAELNFVTPKIEAKKITNKRAVVLCSSKKEFSTQIVGFNQMHSCQIVSAVFTSGSDCKFACVGLGDCVKACPQEAIYIENRTAVISNLCVGCGKCVKACPKGIIKLISKDINTKILCSNSTNKSLTSCNIKRKEEKIERKDKKGFKIWESCYKIIRH